MNLLHLKYAVEVECTRSITKAAENLFMGQPNLSRAIREIEKEFGITLFRRTTKGIVPTKQGEEFLTQARKILLQVQQMEAMYRDGGEQWECRFCLPRAAYCTHAFARFASDAGTGKLSLTMLEVGSEQAVDLVAEGMYDFAVVRTNPAETSQWEQRMDRLGLRWEPLWQAPMVILLPQSSPLAETERISLSQLKDLREVAYADEASVSEESSRILVHEQSSRFEVLGALSNSYMWDSPTPAAILKRFHLIQRRCLEEPYFFCDQLICKKFFRFGKADTQFLSVLKRVQSQAVQALKRL